ncbi:hypothetical protein BOC51_23275 [Burkholderia pseudomallei]|nr:hypothetical protein [Burkholderia pseudomallei]ARL52811.1 hypothetical protein BOC51_23275 [Burkholderia pseudomallei]MDV2126282.1 hypothetical protein [Burkholderia pseudomallei]MDV2204807.1 hypothetical protein [Burkholderia pseudomallei]MDV2233145.1 hypothetical protein [Burkholderia pseudomallei]
MIERVARIGASYLSTHGGCRNGAVCRAAARLRRTARERKLMRTGGRADGRTGGGWRAAADGHVAREIPRRHASPAFAARKRITGHRITQHRITERGHTT